MEHTLPQQPKPDFKGSLFEKIFGDSLCIEDTQATEISSEFAKFRQEVLISGDAFTCMVHAIRSSTTLPPKVAKLAALLWDLVGNRIAPVALGPNVASMHFYAEVPKDGKPVACILCPYNWTQMIAENPVMQFGALVFVGSQAKDYYNERLIDGFPAVRARAGAYEAEYLLHEGFGTVSVNLGKTWNK